MKHYFYIDSAKKQQGPVEASQLIKHGCNLYTYVWTSGMDDWQQIKDVQELSVLFSNQINITLSSSGKIEYSNENNSHIKVENSTASSNIKSNYSHSLPETFLHLLYSVLWFAGAGLIVWALIWFLTESKGGRIKAMGFIAPIYFTWYGVKELGLFFKQLFNL